MGFLMHKQQKSKVVNQTVPDPEATADPSEIGDARKMEDEALFGSESPDLRVNRNGTPAGVEASGSGLKLM